MHDISIVTIDVNTNRVKLLREQLGTHLCNCYGMVAPQHKRIMKADDLVLSSIPFLVAKFFSLLVRLGIVPSYYVYFSKVRTIDLVFARKVSRDESQLVYTNPLFCRTVTKARNKGKKVVVMAGNSEPEREHERIMSEYRFFSIHHRHIYGDHRYAKICEKSFSRASSIITISRVSQLTYENAGYDKAKLHLIPLTGTDFPLQPICIKCGKEKVFISTAFHNFIKGTQRLLLAWKKANFKTVSLVIVGRLCEDMVEFIDKYGPFENVRFMGFFDGSLIDLYKQYDAVGVLLSLSEGAVRTTPELMSFGFPMIVSPDATCDIVEDGKNGFIVNPYDEVEIINKMKWFVEDWNRVDELKKDVISSVSHRTVKDFSFECAEYLLAYINE